MRGPYSLHRYGNPAKLRTRRHAILGSKVVKFNRIVANHLIAKLFRKMPQFVVDGMLRIQPNTIRVGEVRPPLHDVVFAQEVEKPRADLIRLVSRITLPVPIIGRFNLQVEVLELLFPF